MNQLPPVTVTLDPTADEYKVLVGGTWLTAKQAQALAYQLETAGVKAHRRNYAHRQITGKEPEPNTGLIAHIKKVAKAVEQLPEHKRAL